MTLAARATQAPPKPHTGRPCSVKVLLDLLPAERAGLESLLADPGHTAPSIHRAILDEGHRAARQQIAHHRAHRCRCFG